MIEEKIARCGAHFAIIIILFLSTLLQESKNSVAKIKTSLLNLVDLAGSERQRDTHAAGIRLKVGEKSKRGGGG